MSRDIPIKHTLMGNLDRDSDPRNVKGGDYTDAMDIIKQDDDGGVSGTVQPTKRNEWAFSLGEVQPQNKRYRITVDGDASKSHSVRFLSSNRTVNIITGTGPEGEVEFNGTITSLNAAVTSAIIAGGLSWVSTVSGNSLDIEFIHYPHYIWYLDAYGEEEPDIICTQEAIPVNLSGPLKDIGSLDLLNDAFICSTTQDKEPEDLDVTVTSIGPVSGGMLVGPETLITLSTPHDISVGEWVSIRNSDASWLNGIFVVGSVPSSNALGLITDVSFNTPRPYFTPGNEILTINPRGIGAIGVAQKNMDTDTWTYTRLLRSIELNFVSTHAVSMDGKEKIRGKFLYLTDYYNSIRGFVYHGEYMTDGALSYVNEENSYRLGRINLELQLVDTISSEYSELEFVDIVNAGGDLLCGNYYFTYRFYINEAPEYWNELTQPVSIYLKHHPDDAANLIRGNTSDTVTSKVINLKLTGVDTSLYDEVEFAAIRSVADGTTTSLDAFTFKRVPTESVVEVSLTGLEEDTQTLSVPELGTSISQLSIPDKAYDLAIIDGRLALGNIKYKPIDDLSTWAKKIEHTLKYKELTDFQSGFGFRYDGYQRPETVYEYPSLTLNETYRVGVEVLYTSGGKSPTFWVDDIKVDTDSVNQGNIGDNRRLAGLPHYNLTESTYPQGGTSAQTVNIPYISFSGIDMEYLVDGTPLKYLISKIQFRFAKVEREVIASGVVVLGVSGTRTLDPIYDHNIPPASTNQTGSWTLNTLGNISPYLGFAGDFNVNQQIQHNTTSYTYPSSFNAHRKQAFFYSPEVDLGRLDEFELLGDTRLNIFAPAERDGNSLNGDNQLNGVWGNGASIGDRWLPSRMVTYQANAQGVGPLNPTGYLEYDIDFLELLDFGDSVDIDGDTVNNKWVEGVGDSTVNLDPVYTELAVGGATFDTSKCLALKTDQDIIPFNPDGESDKGVYYAQLFKDIPNKYGDLETTVYGSMISPHSTEGITASSELEVFLGDAFISRVVSKYKSSPSPTFGSNLALSYTAQSYINMPLVYEKDGVTFFPDEVFEDWVRQHGQNIMDYNESYSYLNPITNSITYTEDIQTSLEDTPSRVIYSERDLNSSLVDNMRNIPPLNFKDLDGTWGAIQSVDNVNGELFTLQPRKFQLQYFNATGVLQSSNSNVDVLLGDGSVLGRDGNTLSSYGTSHKWSVVKGASPGGKDVIYWFNQDNGLFLRFGADGTLVLSDRHGMRAFSVNDSKWTYNKYTPALGEGIRGVWDDRFKEAIWTFHGVRDVPEYITPTGFLTQTLEGTVVTNPNAPSDSFEDLPRLFLATQSHTNTPNYEPGVGADWVDVWEQIAYNNTDYYTFFTLAYNELTGGFSTEYNHLPKTYLKWKNTFLSSHPTDRNQIFEHRKGYKDWYEYSEDGKLIPGKPSQAFIEPVINALPEASKKYVAAQTLSTTPIDRIELKTKNQESYLEASDFVRSDDGWRSPIKEDSSTTGQNDGDTDSLQGSFLKAKLIWFNGSKNRIHNFIVKVRERVRRYTI